jgi:hypothetical protein
MDEKRKRIQKYFTAAFPKWALILVAIGVLILLGGLSASSAGAILFGLLLGAAGGFGIYSYTQVPTDQQIDEWTAEDLSDLGQRALKKSGIDESELVGESAIITGPADFAVRKVGKDRRLRFGKIAGMVVNFGQNQLLVYTCTVDITTGNTLHETTDEYFYRDVVSVSTKVKDGQLGAIRIASGEYFTLTTSGGTAAEIFLASPEIGKQFGGEMPSSDAQRHIQTIRRMLRDKKSATVTA